MNPSPNMGFYPASDSTTGSTSSPPSPPLQRGKACLACRRRKIKCDGNRPICTPCLRGERIEDCEYTDGPRRARTLMLEEDIARLRARVQELENPEEAQPSVGLYDPYAGPNASSGSAAGPSTSAVRARTQATSPVSFHHPIGRRQTPAPGHFSGAAAEPHQVNSEADIRLYSGRALSVIAPHAAEVGFFLDPGRLRLQGARILPALQSVLTLWSVHITSTSDPNAARPDERTKTLEQTLTSQVQTQLATALSTVDSETDPAIFMHVIQTGVMLSYFMQRVGQLVGAKYYASGTWGLVVMLRLYRASPSLAEGGEREGRHPRRSHPREGSVSEDVDTDPSMQLFSSAGCARLPPSLDEVEAQERVRAFWAVYALDHWFRAVCKVPGQVVAADGSLGNTMTVPWPGTQRSESDETRSNVVRKFLKDPNHDFRHEGASAMHAKAFVLLGEATGIAASFLVDRAISQLPAFRTRLTALDTLLQRSSALAIAMATNAPYGRQSLQTPEQAQACVMVHLIALAQVSLHRPLMSAYGPSRQRCVEAALGVIRLLDHLGDGRARIIGGITPIYATVWTALCLALHDELLRLRAQPGARSSRRGEDGEVVRAIQKLVGFLSALSQSSPGRFFAANIEAVLPALESITA